ncbi:hypothetical protein [Sulfurisphaera ohwakuensis]|uniref:Putative aspartyl protease n=1 Tax=Sulfurisphaera ohwakuensis TaxID=69656 RepID=A0A650CFT2_SULOH|nr:hypothetical protein [Sulfurisphaera ohwakuensis]MBB5254768.1 putative aspartyl protease [Sulfurisphaera ohwakuensis]QGR16397.1 hypothetical protein D1869_03660 [Sulfurisphaera ohwakuensis]
MVGRKFITLKCFKKDNKPNLTLKLYNLLGEEFELNFRVDTGFDGPLMLNNNDYVKFLVGELPEKSWFSFTTLNGYVIMKTAKALLDLEGKRIETYVLTPRDFEGRNLVGLKVLSQLSIVIDKGSETCIVSEL